MFRRLIIPVAVATLGAGAALAADETETRRSIESVERALDRGRERERGLTARETALSRELDRLRTDMAATATAVQKREREADAIEDEIGHAERRYRAARDGLADRRQQMAGTLGALQRIALRPPEAALLGPEPMIDTLRGALLLKAALPPLERDAEALRGEAETLTALRRELGRQRTRLTRALAEVKRERGRLAALVERKEALRRKAEAERSVVAARLETLSGEADGLRELLERLERERRAALEAQRRAEAERKAEAARRAEAERRAAAERREAARRGEPAAVSPIPAPAPIQVGRPPPGPSPSAPALAALPPTRGSYVAPAQGRMVQRYGQGSGVTNHGILLAVRDGTQIVSPQDGRVVYAGPFRGYGVLLIIEHAEGYHTLLSGMTKLDAVTGQWVLAGEPVASIEAVDGTVPNLYVELRHKGQPVDPSPRLAAQKG